jgi:hypothetical protein
MTEPIEPPESPEELSARKQSEMEKLLADGWQPDDLSWHQTDLDRPHPPSPALQMMLSKVRGTFTMTDEDRKTAANFKARMRRGTWLIKGEAVTRRLGERLANNKSE